MKISSFESLDITSTNMRHFSVVLLSIICFSAVAQKPNINKAKAALDKGNLAEAKVIIDQAITYEKTRDKAKTWYYRGHIYTTLDTASNEPGAMAIVLESYKKTLEIDPEQRTISELDPTVGIINVDSKLQGYFAHYYNIGIDYYQSDKFVDAVENFEKAAIIKPEDTSSYINAAYAATEGGMPIRARKNFKRAIETGIRGKIAFLRVYRYAVDNDDLDEALEVIRQAKEIHPDDIGIREFEINILIQQDQIGEAMAGIGEAIEKNPDNPDLYFSMGVIQEGLKDMDGAMSNYEKAVKVDPEHFNSYFNIGVLIFNESTELIKERNTLGYKEQKRYDQLTAQIEQSLNKARPVWERLYSLNNQDQTVLETLGYIYQILKMDDKAMEIADELEALDK